MTKTRKILMFFLFLLGAVVIGGLVAYLTKDISFLSWLSYGQTFGIGLTSPMTVDLGIIVLTFGAGINLNVSVIIFVTVSMIIYGRLYGHR